MPDKINSPETQLFRGWQFADAASEPTGIEDLPSLVQQDVRHTYAQIQDLLGASAVGFTWRSPEGLTGLYACPDQLSAQPLASLLWSAEPDTVTTLGDSSGPLPCYVQPLARVRGEFRLYALGVSKKPSRQKAEVVSSLGRLVVRTVRAARAGVGTSGATASFNSLSELLAIILDPGPLPDLLGKLVEKVATLTRSDAVSLDSYDSDGRLERNAYSLDSSPRAQQLNERWRALVKLRRTQPPMPPQYLATWRTPLVIPDLQSPVVLGGSPREEAQLYRDSGLRTVVLCPLWVRDEVVGVLSVSSREVREHQPRELDALERMAAVVAVGIKSVQLYRDLAESSQRERAAQLESMTRLAWAAEARDPFTGAHLNNIQEYSRRIALAIGCDAEFVDELTLASSMHDIGKIAVPDAVLLKPGPLLTSERELMQRHTLEGERLLSGRFFEVAREVARSHHERWDGTGYPDRLSGNEIPLPARIVSVADVYDALTSVRPYKSAWPAEEAVSEIEGLQGHHFDPEIVEAFVDLCRAGEIH